MKILIMLIASLFITASARSIAVSQVIGEPSANKTIPYWWLYVQWHDEER